MGLLRLLSWLLPGDFRREYGAELLRATRDRWSELRPGLGPVGRAVFWLRQWVALSKAGAALWLGTEILGAADRKPCRPRAVGLGNELRQTARSLGARPGFTAIVVLTLGLGVGATTTMWSVVDAVLLDPLPYPDPDRIVVLQQEDVRDGSFSDGVSAANLRDLAAAARTLDAAAIAVSHGLRLMEDGRAVSLRAWVVSEGFFEALAVEVEHGRGFRPEEYGAGRERVVLLSHGTWRSRYGGELAVVGRDLILDGAPHRVVGILPQGFRYPSAADVWAPRPFTPEDEERRSSAGFESVARLAAGVELAQARSELAGIAVGLAAAHPEANASLGFRLQSLRQHLLGHVRAPLLLLLGAVVLVLLIAIANVAGLQMARSSARCREFALRGALGAGSPVLLRLVAVECLLLGAAGAL
ncbi:MAG: ABC transporter permease, partial [Holophagales bacterium]|nr:ABC transporter permease [Holophagales bacterium]